MALTIDYLREALNYDKETGVLTWCARPQSHFKSEGMWRRFLTMYAGRATGRHNAQGYLVVGIGGKLALAHRIAWALIKGIDLDEVPAELDHKNTTRDDNREANLRPATRTQNTRNTKLSAANSSGYKGVYFDKALGFWRSRIMVDGKNRHLGLFDTVEAAAEARAAAQVLHGEFARLSANDNSPMEAAA